MSTSVEIYETIDAAVADFWVLSGVIVTGSLRRELRESITENGLSRRYVADLAADMVASLSHPAVSAGVEIPVDSHLPVVRPCADCPLLRGADRKND